MNLYLQSLLILIVTTSSRITFQNGVSSSQITVKDIKPFSQVLVQAHFHNIDDERFQKLHLAVRCINKHKKQAYVDLMKKYHGVVRTLIKLKAIPNQQAMIQSVIHRNYLRKSRKWEFFRYFVVYALKQDIQQIKENLQKFHPQTVKAPPVVHYLNQKFMSIAAFIEAKIELEKFIKENLNNEYKILLTKDIEIVTQKISNEGIIEKDIEQQFNKNALYQQASEQTTQQIQQTKQIYGYYAKNKKYNKESKKLDMKVLFKLVDRSADVQEILSQIDDKMNEEGISYFEGQFENEENRENSQNDYERDEEQAQDANQNEDL